MDMDLDVVPMGEFVGDDLRGRRVVGGEVLNRLVEKTTPQPNVSPSRLRSKTWMSCDASRNFIEIAK